MRTSKKQMTTSIDLLIREVDPTASVTYRKRGCIVNVCGRDWGFDTLTDAWLFCTKVFCANVYPSYDVTLAKKNNAWLEAHGF